MNDKEKIVINISLNGEFYFNVVARNNKILSTSKMFDSEESLNKGISYMKEIFNNEEIIIENATLNNENI